MKNNLFLLALCALLFSCDKDDNDDNQEPTKTQLITQASWKYENAGMDADRNGTIDYAGGSMIQDCVKDNILTLQANGSGTVDEGPTKCDPAAPQSTSVTWSFSSNETIVNMNGGSMAGISGPAKILVLSSTSLHLSKDTTIAPFGNVALIVQLKH